MGLFPIALKSALESQRETRATQIAQQIFNDLRAFPATNTLIATSTNILDPQIRLNLTNNSSYAVSFSVDGKPIGGANSPGAIYSAEVTAVPNSPAPKLTTISAVIESPASAVNRSRYYFVTVLSQK